MTSFPDHVWSLSLFTGAGGMDIGLERAGFHPICYLDNSPITQATIQLNRPDWTLWEDGDVLTAARSLSPRHFGMAPGDLALVSGGPPCQPFSAAAQWAANGRRGMKDHRSLTIHALIDLIASFVPKMVLLENVQGFVSGRTSAIPVITEGLDAVHSRIGVRYTIMWQLLNAADYGVPQNRRRAIIVLLRDDVADAWAWPDASHADSAVTAWDVLADLCEHDLPAAKGKWTELLPCIPEGWNYQWLTSRGGGAELFGYRTRYWHFLLKLAKALPSWTVPASPGPAAGPFHWDNRPLSSRERLRLQSFPDDWKLAGDHRIHTHLVGNATPPLLAEVLGVALMRTLGHNPCHKRPTLLRGKSTIPLEPSAEPASLPPEFRHMVGGKLAHGGTGRGPAPRSQAP